MAQNPRDRSLVARVFQRLTVKRPEPEPQADHAPQWTPPPDHGKEKAHIPAAFYTGLEPRKPRRPRRSATAEPARPGRAKQDRALTDTFEDRSLSARTKREQAFEKRFKGAVARAEAREAIDEADILRKDAQNEHIERMREWQADLRFFVSGNRPVPAEAGADINRRMDALYERHDREMAEIDAELHRALGWAESLDLAEDKRRQKLLGIGPDRKDQKLIGYTPDRPRDFAKAAQQPVTIIVPPGPGQMPEAPARPDLAYAFNDAVTAPDPLADYFAQFRAAAPPPQPADPNRQRLGPDL